MNIANLDIEPGILNWEKRGLTSGSVTVRFPDGTRVDITCTTTPEGWINKEIAIHRLKGTEVTIFQPGNTLTKKTVKGINTPSIAWTEIKEKKGVA